MAESERYKFLFSASLCASRDGFAGALFPPNDESGGRALVSTDFWSPVSVLSWALRDQRSPHDGSMGHCIRRCRRDSSSLVDAGPDGGCAAVREDVRRRAEKMDLADAVVKIGGDHQFADQSVDIVVR